MKRFLFSISALLLLASLASPLQANDFIEGTAFDDTPVVTPKGAQYGLFPGVAASFGTKFVCCRPENVSTLGGGGGTIWHTTLRDRALTQVDAKARCGFHKMFWATHSCPSDPIGGGGGGGVTNQIPKDTEVRFCNHTPTKIYFAYAIKGAPQDGYLSRGWYRIWGNDCQTLNFSKYRGEVYAFASSPDRKMTWSSGSTRFCVNKKDAFNYKTAKTALCTGVNLDKPKFGSKFFVGPGSQQYDFLNTPTEQPAEDKRITWKYGGRYYFQYQGNKIWVEQTGDRRIRFVESARTADFVELYDADRLITVRLYNSKMYWRTNGDWVQLHNGSWN